MPTSATARLLASVVVFVSIATVAAAAESLPVVPGSYPSSDFEASQSCGCHAAQLQQWSTSMHSQALDDPAYLYKLEEAQEATGGKLGAFCNTCHGPIATMSR